MSNEQAVILSIGVATLALFLWGRWRHDMVALAALLACVASGLVPARDAFAGFAHPAVITVACVLVLSQGLLGSGAVDALTRRLLPARAGPTASVAALTALGAVLSAFINNVGALALLMPVALQIAKRLELAPGRVLMPLAFGSILGGTTTLAHGPAAGGAGGGGRRPGAALGLAAVSGRGTVTLLAGILLACTEPRDVELPTLRPTPAYESLYPHYAEICALDQYRKLDGTLGVAAGHAVMYLKGACLRADAPYPQLEACPRRAEDPLDRKHGTGISVNRILRNVNWLGVPGKRLFFDGNLAPDQVLDAGHYEATLQHAAALGLFRGIRIREDELARRPAGMPVEEFISREAIGTDFALRFARSVLCARLPVSAAMMEQIIGFLNGINAEYATGEADYAWSGYHDNCAHLLRNALAAASIWRPKAVWEIKLRQIFHLAIPANEFLALAERGNDFPIDQYWRVFLDDEASTALEEFGWLPTRDGALLRVLPIHAQNQVFDTRYALFVLENPLRRPRTRQFVRMLEEPRYHDLETNLRHFEATYAQILAEHSAPRGAEPGEARERWRSYVEGELVAVREKLRRLCEEVPCTAGDPDRGSAH